MEGRPLEPGSRSSEGIDGRKVHFVRTVVGHVTLVTRVWVYDSTLEVRESCTGINVRNIVIDSFVPVASPGVRLYWSQECLSPLNLCLCVCPDCGTLLLPSLERPLLPVPVSRSVVLVLSVPSWNRISPGVPVAPTSSSLLYLQVKYLPVYRSSHTHCHLFVAKFRPGRRSTGCSVGESHFGPLWTGR